MKLLKYLPLLLYIVWFNCNLVLDSTLDDIYNCYSMGVLEISDKGKGEYDDPPPAYDNYLVQGQAGYPQQGYGHQRVSLNYE